MDFIKKCAAVMNDSPVWRYVRIILLVTLGVGLMQPYLTHGTYGGGDARVYANAVSDFNLQVRAGIFPVWVGQSEFSIFGSTFPLRYAPYLQHLTALVDLGTGRRLPLFYLLNVALAVSVIGGLLSCYLCLLSIIPRRPWSAVALALLYITCPGVIGLAYAQDLYMSVSSLPFLPMIFLGMVRSCESNDLASRLLMAGSLAGAWLAHPPIAMWAGLVVVAAHGVRLLRQGLNRRDLTLDALTLVCFFMLAGYSFVSVLDLSSQWQFAPVQVGDLLFQIRHAFPSNWLPVTGGASLENVQAGYGLAGFLGLCIGAFLFTPREPLRAVLAVSGVLLLVLAIPVPVLTETLWRLLPQQVIQITNIWPMQRVFVIFALCTVFCAALLGRQLEGKSHRLRWVGSAFLVVALAWSGFQASRFIGFASQNAPSLAATQLMQRPENLIVPNSAGGVRTTPPRYASGGVMDPELEHHFLDRSTRKIRSSVTDAIMPGFGPGPKTSAPLLAHTFVGKLNANPGILDLSPTLRLEPGQRYLLAFEFLDHDYTGLLIIHGPEFHRLYSLPLSGESRAFGAGRESSHVIPLWTSLDKPIEVQLQFVPTGGKQAPLGYVPFARFDLRAYERRQLPVQLESLLPYCAIVQSDEPVYLETSKLYVSSYEAAVDGVSVPVQVSDDGYVIIPVDSGSHRVTLKYVAPAGVRLAFWASAVSWIALGIAFVCKKQTSTRTK